MQGSIGFTQITEQLRNTCVTSEDGTKWANSEIYSLPEPCSFGCKWHKLCVVKENYASEAERMSDVFG